MVHIGTILLDFLYPPRCPVCDGLLRSSSEQCHDSCRKKLPWVRGPICMKCGKPVSGMEREFCHDCSQTEHMFDQGIAPFTYSGVMRRCVYRMKAENRRDYMDFFAAAMEQSCRRQLKYWKPDLIIAVPIHKSRRRKRGYNQSDLLAGRISRLTGIPYDRDLVKCIRKAAVQKELGRKERLSNLRGCFEVSRKITPGMRVLVVDDVYTTGSTMDEISRILKKAGAKNVFFVVLCTGKGKNAVCTGENM